MNSILTAWSIFKICLVVNRKTAGYLTNILIVPVLLLGSVQVHQLTVVTTVDYGPYNYLEEGKVKGLVTEIVRAALTGVDLEAEISAYPRSRAYKTLLEKNILFYTIARTVEQEGLFQWLGPVAPLAKLSFYKLKEQEGLERIIINSLKDVKKYKVWSSEVQQRMYFCKKTIFQ